MRKLWRNRQIPTQGERARALAYIAVALFGAGFAFVTVTRMNGERVLGTGLTWYDLWIVISGGIGAAAALFLARDKIGQPGLRGVYRAAFGTVWISFVGALIAGTLALPLYGTMFGPFTLGVTLTSAPMLAMLWFANLLSVHVLMLRWHIERESIFAKPVPPMPVRRSSHRLRMAGRVS
ncbi:hypothetical protein [Octadecabacter sp. R77987]|uniref:hypothetical protein n=1 Tax=Octadecabacter sp. R77987 TaxID=3093874 RepID=UPI00366D7191